MVLRCGLNGRRGTCCHGAEVWTEREDTYLSMLMAQRLNMEAVHSITSMVIRASQMDMFKDQMPSWNFTHTHTHTHCSL